MDEPQSKPVTWLGSTRRDLKAMPDRVQDSFGYALYLAQTGLKHANAKPLSGFGGAGILEIVENYDGDTYRAVYTVRFAESVYVLHVFQKKSRKGIKTPQAEINLIKTRLRQAEEIHQERTEAEERGNSDE